MRIKGQSRIGINPTFDLEKYVSDVGSYPIIPHYLHPPTKLKLIIYVTVFMRRSLGNLLHVQAEHFTIGRMLKVYTSRLLKMTD